MGMDQDKTFLKCVFKTTVATVRLVFGRMVRLEARDHWDILL